MLQPFITALLLAGNPKLAATFIPKATNLTLEKRIELYVKCNMVTRAAEEAFKAKDLKALQELKQKASGPTVGEVDRMIVQLRPRR